MPVRIVHTADNHIGIPYRQFGESLRSQLLSERFNALGRLVATANERKADFFIIAGDLFDSTRVKIADIEKTVELLKGFCGEAVLIVPGNHDYYAGPDSECWKKFRRACESAANVELLTDQAVREFEVDGLSVQFFPCSCPSKTGSEPTTGWVNNSDRNTGAVRIGIAHGNVTGLGLDAADRYFNMDPPMLEAAGLTTWLLGHIHVPFPTSESGGHSPYFMAGIHTPDSLRVRHAGSAWYLECEPDRVVRYERLSPGRIRFVRIVRELTADADTESLMRECLALDGASTILDLQLSGQLAAADRKSLHDAIDRLRESFLELSVDDDIRDRIDANTIAASYPTGSLAERLLSALVDDSECPDAAMLAYELMQEISER
jgi:exonuclease SbcD